MTHSTTNTAARELLASALDECGRPTDAAEVREGRNPFVRGEYALVAIEAVLTQPQGGEQEVAWQSIETAEAEFLTNLADKGGLADPVPGMLRHCARLIAGKRPAVVAPDRYETEEEGDAYAHGYVDGEDAALRTQQQGGEQEARNLVENFEELVSDCHNGDETGWASPRERDRIRANRIAAREELIAALQAGPP